MWRDERTRRRRNERRRNNQPARLCHFDGKLAQLCVMGEVGGGKKAFIIARAQAKPHGEMESVIVAGVDLNQNDGASERKSRKSAMWSSRAAILNEIKEKCQGISPSTSLGCKEDARTKPCYSPINWL